MTRHHAFRGGPTIPLNEVLKFERRRDEWELR